MSSIEESREGRTDTGKPEQFIKRPSTSLYFYKVHKDQKSLSEIMRIFSKWEPSSEIWVYNYGAILLGAASTFTAFYVNHHFRQTLYLLQYSRITSYVALFLGPGLAATGSHYFLVTHNVLTEKPMCAACLQVRGTLSQVLCSIGYPLILVPVICYPVAKRLQNYSVPNISLKNRYPVLKFTREMLKPIRGPLWAMTAAHLLLGMGMTYYEQSNFLSVVKPRLKEFKTHHPPNYPRADAD